MALLRGFSERWKALFSRSRVDAEMDEELPFQAPEELVNICRPEGQPG